MPTPYEILGVSENASQDEVKKAYRKKARENHPDLNPDDPQAAERMNQINDAYDRIMNPEKYARERRTANPGQQGGSAYNPYGQRTQGNPYGQRTTYGEQGPGGNTYGWSSNTYTWEDIFGFGFGGPVDPSSIHPGAAASDSAEVRAAINYINAGNYREGASILNNIKSTGRNARWYYLAAIANHGAGNTMLAYDQIRRAVQMDPENADYRRALSAFQQRSQTYQQTSESQGFRGGLSFGGAECCCAIVACNICLNPWICMRGC